MPSRRASVSSNHSINIDEALECFNFLDSESDEEGDHQKSGPATSSISSEIRSTQNDAKDTENAKESAKDRIHEANITSIMDSENLNSLRDIVASKEGTTIKDHTNSLDSKCSLTSNLNSLGSSGKSSLSNTLEDKSIRSSEGSKSSDSSTLEDKSRSSGQSSFSNTLEDKSARSGDYCSSGTSTLEAGARLGEEAPFLYVEGCMNGSRELHKCLYIHLRTVLKLLQVRETKAS